ncbi:aspartate--tRNA(Asn) ligase [Candidatus Woesearchaeota archaeon]|nr:aspartate--tRNA(Asn) ligase [Candidatus Woesearchaeota archaeon]
MIKNLRDELGKKEVVVEAWIQDYRSSGKITFLILRDLYDVYQGVVKNKKIDLSQESFVRIKGYLKDAVLKSNELTIKDKELVVEEIEIVSPADPLPIPIVEKGVNTGLDKRLDYRYLDIRKPSVRAIFRIESTIINSFRRFFYDKGFIEIQPPGIIATSTEGGTDLFPIKYFEKKAFLAQSPQLYKQLGAISLGRVFSTSPVWRAEKHNTTRHLNEIRQLDIEVAMADDMEVMKLLEECIQFIVRSVKKENKEDLGLLGINLVVPKAVYLSYDGAIKELNNAGYSILHGEDLDPGAERKLAELYPDSIIFVHSWPIELKPFYIWPKDKNKGISAGFDALLNGLEISSGGQRIHKPEVLIGVLKEKGLNPENFKWYIDAFRYGAPPHSGWSIGLERITMALLRIENIREVTLFPRDRHRLTP